jgi:hypothetical protein
MFNSLFQGRCMKSYLFFLSLVLGFATVVNARLVIATELPAILDYYPQCQPEILDTVSRHLIYDVEELLNPGDKNVEESINVLSFKDVYINKALLDFRHKAQLAGADAVIIEKMILKTVDRDIALRGKHEQSLDKLVKQIHLLMTVKNIKLCDNRALSSKPTPYNSTGAKVTSTNVVVSIVNLNKESLLTIASKHHAPKANITVDSAYGIKIGDSLSRLKAALGPESIHLAMKDGTKAYGYGRNLWFFVNNNNISKITKNYDLVNGHGKNQIEFSENYDSDDWIIEGLIYNRDTLDSVKQNISLKNNAGSYIHSNGQNKLILKFDDFKPDGLSDSVKLLNGFMISPLNDKPTNHEIDYANFDNINIKSLVELNVKQKYMLKPEQLLNEIVLNKDSRWLVANDNLLLGMNEQGELNKVRITESLVKDQGVEAFRKVLSSYKIPLIKSDFLDKYPNAEDDFDNISLNEGSIFLTANFDSHEDDAQLINLVLEFR